MAEAANAAVVTADTGGGAAAATNQNGSATAASSVTTTTGLPAPPAWLPGADADTVAYLQSKGWDKSSNPAEAILGSYRSLEKLWGADKAGQTVQIPADGADSKTMDNFYNKLGRPESVDKYSSKVADIKGMPGDTAKAFVDLAFKEGLTDRQVKAVVAWNNESGVKIQQSLEANASTQLSSQQAALKTEWGAAYDGNIQTAKEAATKLGWTAEQINAMQLGLGFDGVMKLAHQLGTQVGEGKFVQGEGGRATQNGNGALSPAQASQELKKLMADPTFQKEWMTKTHPNHANAIARKAQLTAWSIGQQ